MSVSKVVYGNNTVIDITDSTISADTIINGYIGYGADGNQIVGNYKVIPLDTYIFDLNCGYITAGKWKYENPTGTYVDMYPVVAGHTYFITLGGNVGTRFRSMFSTVDVSKVTTDVTGITIKDVNNPAKYANVSYTTNDDGYILIAKDNAGKQNVKTYVYDATECWL